MKVISGIGKVNKQFKNSVLVIGIFDGMHKGHQALIQKAVQRARELRVKTTVMTFSPHPVRVLHQNKHLSYISAFPYRLKLMETLGVDQCLVIPFTKRFADLSPQNFIQRYLIEKIQPQEVLVGDDFRFGQKRRGTLETFRRIAQEFGIKVNGVHPLKTHQEKISSTDIRELITEGRLKEVKKLLGRDFSIMGKVVRGKGIGRKLGFPTANINLNKESIPPIGVYAVRVIVEGKNYAGMANIGRRPTFNERNMHANVEVFLFDFCGDLYGKEIVVEFLQKIRDEEKFSSAQALEKQINKDQGEVKKLFSKKRNNSVL